MVALRGKLIKESTETTSPTSSDFNSEVSRVVSPKKVVKEIKI